MGDKGNIENPKGVGENVVSGDPKYHEKNITQTLETERTVIKGMFHMK